MNSYFSPSVGVIASATSSEGLTFQYLGSELDISDKQLRSVASLISDWESIENADDPTEIERALRKHHVALAVSYARGVLSNLNDEELEQDLLKCIDEALQSRISLDSVLAELLVAPLKRPESAKKIASAAFSHGFMTTAKLFDDLHDQQPLLRRLVSAWLGIPESDWLESGIDRTIVWNSACSAGIVAATLNLSDSRQIRRQWNTLLMDASLTSQPRSRVALTRIFQKFSDAMFPDSLPAPAALEACSSNEDTWERAANSWKRIEPPHLQLQQVRLQIDSIVGYISKSDEQRAIRFYEELVSEQLGTEGGETHVVKTLCNLAKRCADMFRTDWERRCLDRAYEIDQRDTRTLCQIADHLKRVGNFSGANQFYVKAAAEGEVYHTAIGMADVLAAQGDFEGANKRYMAIPDWESDGIAMTAVADNIRRLGRLEEAEALYKKLQSEAKQMDRSAAGLADIASKRGDLATADALYSDILDWASLDKRSRVFYRLALCDVKKRRGDLLEAYRIADLLVNDAPFFMRARIQRGTILGMLDRCEEALSDIPDSRGSLEFGEWVRDYYRGILLLKLGKYEEAKRRLVDGLKVAMVQGNERTMVRLGAVAAHLSSGSYGDAESELEGIADFGDLHSQYLTKVLQLHLAVVRNDREKAEEIARFLKSRIETMPVFVCVVDALLRNDLIEAQKGEFNLLLAATPDVMSMAV